MAELLEKNSIKEKKEDAGKLIAEVLLKVPEDKKPEILGIVRGYALCAESNKKDLQKA